MMKLRPPTPQVRVEGDRDTGLIDPCPLCPPPSTTPGGGQRRQNRYLSPCVSLVPQQQCIASYTHGDTPPVGLLHIFGDGFQAESLGFRMLERPPPPDKARRRRGIRSRSAARGRRGDWFHRREITAVIRARPTDDRGDRGAAGRARGLADRRRRGGWTSHRRLSRSGPTGPFCRPRSSAVEAVPRAAACGDPYCAGAHA
jgi:hypothetical protein